MGAEWEMVGEGEWVDDEGSRGGEIGGAEPPGGTAAARSLGEGGGGGKAESGDGGAAQGTGTGTGTGTSGWTKLKSRAGE